MRVYIASMSELTAAKRWDAGFHTLIGPMREQIAALKRQYPSGPNGEVHPELAQRLADIRRFADTAEATKLIYRPLSRSSAFSFGQREIDAVEKEYPHEILACVIANKGALLRGPLDATAQKLQDAAANLDRITALLEVELPQFDETAETPNPGVSP